MKLVREAEKDFTDPIALRSEGVSQNVSWMGFKR